jgi:hypothetical protein
VDDLLQWDGNFYEPAVGGQGLLDRLHTRGILTSGDTIAYALGLSVGEYRGLRRVEHGGSWAGFRAQLTRYPDQRTSIVVLCNRADASPGAYAREVAEAVLAQGFPELPPEPRRMEREAAPEAREAEEAAPPQPTPAELRMYAGRYYSEELDTTFEVALDAGELWLHRPGRDPSRLRFGGTNQFQGGGLRLTFLRDGGRVLGLRIFAGRVTGIEFLRQAG